MSKINREIILNEYQEQIILSGIIGDGNIKRNGRNYYYRETHSKKEKEYCYFKYNILKEHISKAGFHETDKRDGQFGFQTINATNLRGYKMMNKIDTINSLNEFGLILLILDDGWKSYEHFCLSTGTLNEEEINLLISKYNSIFNIKCKKIGKSRIDISFSGQTEIILLYFIKYIPNNIDIFKNKILPLINKFKV